jgi:hypothetical protein
MQHSCAAGRLTAAAAAAAAALVHSQPPGHLCLALLLETYDFSGDEVVNPTNVRLARSTRAWCWCQAFYCAEHLLLSLLLCCCNHQTGERDG